LSSLVLSRSLEKARSPPAQITRAHSFPDIHPDENREKKKNEELRLPPLFDGWPWMTVELKAPKAPEAL